jgi:hypothetical protein
MKKALLILSLFVLSLVSSAQQTVLNVPSADVLDKGKAYFRVDSTFFPITESATVAPNFIYGVGHNVEVGINVDAFGIPGDASNRAIAPNVKWRFLNRVDSNGEGLVAYVGDKVYFPTHQRTYTAGNYLYGAAALQLGTGTRIGAGVWNSQNVYALGNRTGALLTLEQAFSRKFTGAIDWQSGHAGNGYTTFGLMWFPTDRLMIIPAYQVSNSWNHANHGATVFIGYKLN